MVEEGKQVVDDFDAAVNNLNSNTEPDGLEPEQPTEPVVAPKQEASEPTEPVFDIDGEKVPASVVKQWKSGHLMQSDYTRKTQELAREREQLNLLRQTLEDSLYGEPPVAAPQAKPIADRFRTIPVEENIEFATPTEEKLYKELLEIKGAVGSLQQRQRMEQVRAINAKIDNSIDSFMRAHPDVDGAKMNEILAHANKIGVREASPESFEFVYRSMADPREIERRAIERYVEDQKKKAPAAMENPAGVSSDMPAEDIRGLGEEDIYTRMVRDLRIGST